MKDLVFNKNCVTFVGTTIWSEDGLVLKRTSFFKRS